MMEIKYDIRRGTDIYRAIYAPRLRSWISKGVIKRGDALVWRSGLSGWRKAEELEELAPFFKQCEKQQLEETERREDELFLQKKKKKKKKKINNILIIDDEKDLCSLFFDILNQRGYKVTIANTKRQGAACIKRETPEVVFLDLKLPDGDGMTLLSKIKEINPETVVNIISAYGSEERKEEAKRKGASSFMDKPFTKEQILRSVE